MGTGCAELRESGGAQVRRAMEVRWGQAGLRCAGRWGWGRAGRQVRPRCAGCASPPGRQGALRRCGSGPGAPLLPPAAPEAGDGAECAVSGGPGVRGRGRGRARDFAAGAVPGRGDATQSPRGTCGVEAPVGAGRGGAGRARGGGGRSGAGGARATPWGSGLTEGSRVWTPPTSGFGPLRPTAPPTPAAPQGPQTAPLAVLAAGHQGEGVSLGGRPPAWTPTRAERGSVLGEQPCASRTCPSRLSGTADKAVPPASNGAAATWDWVARRPREALPSTQLSTRSSAGVPACARVPEPCPLGMPHPGPRLLSPSRFPDL